MFQHLILTRFNLQTDVWKLDKNENEILGKEWLEERIKLFLHFCLPSVIGQSNQNFKWLIFFQEGTHKELDKVLKAIEPYKHIHPIFKNGYEHFKESLSDVIYETVGSKSIFYISTRLDNDDAININFVKEIQANFIKSKLNDVIIDFPNGLSLDINSKPRLAAIRNVSNHFISYVENNNKSCLKTVFAHEHNKWAAHSKIIRVNKNYMWLQISHGRNIINKFQGKKVTNYKLRKFNIQIPEFSFFFNYFVFFERIQRYLPPIPGRYFLKKIKNRVKKK